MRKKFTFLTAAIALLVGLAFPMGMRGQTKTEGFETASASTTYNSSATINANQSDCGIAWSIYYGNVSTTSPITGSKSCLMRYYTNSPNNLGYAATTTGIQGLTNVTFNAKVTNTGNKMGVWYSTDGNNWNAIATDVELTTNSAEKSYDIPNSSSSTSYYIKIGITSATTNKKDLIIDDVVFTYSSNSTIYTVTYHANVTGVEDIEVEYTEGDDVTVADNTFNKPGYAFTEWNTEEDGSGTSYDPEDVIENINSDIDLYAQWEESASTTGTINFGNSTGYVAITESEVKGDDNLGNEWTITTVGTTYFYAGYSYNQIGSGNAPASSITFTTTLPEEVNVTAMEAKFGGFSGTAGTITMKVGNTTIGTGSLNAANDVTVNSSSTETGNVLTVTITSISKGVKAYYISYTYEAATPNPAVVTTTTINVPSDFNNDISQGTNAGILTATVTPEGGSALDNPAITWSSSNTGVATIDANGAVTLVAVGTTTITASYAGVEDEYRPSTGTYELTVTDSNAPGTENNPYTVEQALSASPSNDVFVHGIISTITEVSTSYGNATYSISDDGTTSGEMIVYRGKYLENVSFTSSDQIKVGDIVTVRGNLSVYNGTNQLAQGNYLVSLERPGVATYTIMFSVNGVLDDDLQRDVQGAIGTLPTPDAADIPSGFTFMGWMISPSTPYYNATTAPSMVEATWEPGEDEILEAVFARVNSTSGTWTLSNTAPENGDQVIMAALDGTSYYAMNGPAGIVFSVSNNVITGDVPDAVFEAEISSEGSYLKQGSNYLHFNSTALKLASGTTNGDITYAPLNDGFSLCANSRYMTFNSSTHGFGVNQTQSNAATIYIFKYIAGSESISDYTTLVYTKDITGYGGDNDYGYTLIASPIDNVNPANVTGMTDGNFDLYRFNENAELEWENWKQEGDHNHFNLERGKGYLYAHKTDVTLAFAGTPVQGTTFNVTLSKTTDAEYEGVNLVGNPFGQTAYIDRDFYVMNQAGSDFITSSGAIAPMQGIIVGAASHGETLTFTTEAPSNSGNAKVAINLSRNRGDVIDRAIVRFDEGSQLHKFQLRENSTKVYFTEGNQDFAVVRSQKAQGEMPVNFKAEENGTYTLDINTENVEMNYLHLIDNMTGMDVDLLQTPSYTFDANTNDYTSRFRLVFSANNEEGSSTGSGTFAFYSNGNWVIGNEGEATLQVIDVNGRIVSNETINGTVATSINATPGVYMLRLVNGNEVKTQKIVVR